MVRTPIQYGTRYSATRRFLSTIALHLLRRGFCTLVLFIIGITISRLARLAILRRAYLDVRMCPSIFFPSVMNNRGKLLWLITTSFLVLVNDVAAIPLEQFYPFGLDAGDNLLNRTLDGSSSKISLPRPLPFFGKSFDDIYVSKK